MRGLLRLVPGSATAVWRERTVGAAGDAYRRMSGATADGIRVLQLRGAQLLEGWRRLSLDRQFLVAASFVILMGMLVIGIWVADRIKTGIV